MVGKRVVGKRGYTHDDDDDDEHDDDVAVSCVACQRPFEGSYCIKVTLDNWEGAGILS